MAIAWGKGMGWERMKTSARDWERVLRPASE
jgi:hypothetical protein